MSAFGIFALILTTAYIIYFLVIIGRDVASSKKSGGDESQTETFDVSEFAQEESVEVKETTGGFAVGDNEVNSTVKATEPAEPEGSPSPSAEEKLAALKEQMNSEAMPLVVKDLYSHPLTDEEYYDSLQDPTHKIDNGNLYIKRIPAGEPTQESSGNGQGRDAM